MNVSHLHRSRGRVLASGVLLAAIVTGTVIAGPSALASQFSAGTRSAQTVGSGPISWSVIPASATQPDTRAKFSYTNIKPGSTITDHVAVLNRGKQSIAFEIYGTDATGTTLTNALTLLPAGKTPLDIGSWVKLPGGVSQQSIVIGGGHGIVEAFKVLVPGNATPGDHTGGVIGQVSFNRRNSKGQLVTEYQRIAVPLELRVAGPLHAGLAVESIATEFHTSLNPFGSGSATVSYTVHNTGNVRITGSQSVSVTGPFGISSLVRLNNLPTVLPGDSVRVTAAPGGLFPLGPMTAHVRLSPAIPTGAPPMALPTGNVTGTASLFAVPWSLLGLIVLVVAAAIVMWRGRGWQRRRLRAKLAAAAEGARAETEQRLLGNKGTAAGPQAQA
jgi:hypothetical protein